MVNLETSEQITGLYMLNSILQTLADILARGTSLTSTEQINFSHPAALKDQSTGPLLNLYLYDLRASKRQHSGRQTERRPVSEGKQKSDVSWAPDWFDVSMILMAQDRTVLREHHLLTEALTVLLRHRSLREEFLAPALRGYGNLCMSVSTDTPIDVSNLWSALSVSIQPAIFLTVTIPLQHGKTTTPVVAQSPVVRLHPYWQEISDRTTASWRVAAAGVVKNALTTQPLAGVEVLLTGTEKAVMSNPEGRFFFENLNAGNYVLQLSLSGFQTQSCNVLVDRSTSTFKEVLLLPI